MQFVKFSPSSVSVHSLAVRCSEGKTEEDGRCSRTRIIRQPFYQGSLSYQGVQWPVYSTLCQPKHILLVVYLQSVQGPSSIHCGAHGQ